MTKIKVEYKPTVREAIRNNSSKLHQIHREPTVELNPYTRGRFFIYRIGWKIEGEEGVVKKVTDELIDTLGIPYFAASGTDYELLNEVLESYGMTTERKLVKSLFVESVSGRYVVPIKT